MEKRVVIVLLVFCVSATFAQTDSAKIRRVGISYFSEGGSYPGFSLNYEKRLLGNNNFQLLAGAKAGVYFHYRNHTGVFLMAQSGQRFRLSKHLYFEHFLGIGYLHSFLSGGAAYYVNASSQIQKAHDLGNPHFMPSISLGLSYDLVNIKHPVMLFARPMIFWQIPFNQVSLVQYAFEVGALFKLQQ